ncbi:MAG: Kef family K(+) transporter [Micavibrio aeruginosavorus]|uniref:Kef family K(+) transporter n=1 Tax=Micavibrio aeruginosavorus TaxID=349221 RepID=A0A2W5HR29_9BACT|nr:MAG: Kef family K(+) transporter [Micavibrio aeruginosavorus]
MSHELPLVTTLAVGLSLAFACGLLAAKFRIPPIVGYLFAGVLIGPYSPGYTADLKIAEELSEIGIVLLMFGVGLHFSLKDLMDVRKIAVPGAIAQIAATMAMGALMSHYWGWPLSSGLLFGLALSVASTVVLLRSLEENNLLQSTDGQITVGWLIVEDLVMVLALVLIPALAAPGEDIPGVSEGNGTGPVWQQLLFAGAKVCAFMAVMLIVGRRFFPWLLAYVARTGSRELFTLAVFAAAIGVAFAAAKLFGVSFALGAFFSGMMIKESNLNHEVADRALPFQDAFAVLFFVSVGMLFDPGIIIDEPLTVLLVAFVIMFGKSIVAFIIVMMFGYPLRTGLLVSAGLAQIGEFSFILVALGMTLDILPKDGRDLILAGAIISISFNPLMFIAAKKLYTFVDRRPVLRNKFNMKRDRLAHLLEKEKAELNNVVIMIGHGRVGKYIRRYLQEYDFDLVVIDGNRERVKDLRRRGFHALSADAGDEAVLEEAQIKRAMALIIAVPDVFEARRIVLAARALNPDIKILARAHNEEEMGYFQENEVDLAVSGPHEIGRRMARYVAEMKIENRRRPDVNYTGDDI